MAYTYSREQATSFSALNPKTKTFQVGETIINVETGKKQSTYRTTSTISQPTPNPAQQTPAISKTTYTPPPIVWTGTEEEWKIRSGQQTSQERAVEAVKQVEIRSTFPEQTRFISGKQNIRVDIEPQAEPKPFYREYKPETSPISKLRKYGETQEQAASRSRIEGRLGFFQEARGQTATYLADTGESFKKTVSNPVNLIIVGGAFALTRNPKTALAASTALELYTPFYATQKAKEIGEGKTTLGGVTGEVGGFAAFGFIGSKVLPKQKPSFTIEESGTRRTTTEGYTLDITQAKSKAILGKSVKESRGLIKTEYFNVEEGFNLRGTGKVTDVKTGKETGLDIRGFGKKVEGGTDVISITKATRGKKSELFIDFTQSAELSTEPVQTFKTLTRTGEVTGKTDIYFPKTREVKTGTTGELYIEDIFTGKNIFRKEVLSESGRPIATEQLLFSNKYGVGGKEFIKEFEFIRVQPKRYSNLEFDSGGASRIKTKEIIKTNDIPVQNERLLQITKQQAGKGIQALELRRVTKETAVLGVETSNILRQETKQRQEVKLIQENKFKLVTAQKPTTAISFKLESRPVQQAAVSSLYKIDTRQTISTKPEYAFKEISVPISRQATTSYNYPPIIPAVGFLPFTATGLYLPESYSREKRYKGKFKRQINPTVRGIVFKTGELQSITGLGGITRRRR